MVDFITNIHESFFDADRIPLLVIAIILTVIGGMITGPYRGNANPFMWWVMDQLFGRLGDRMDKISRPRGDLIFRGFLLCALLLFFALLFGKYVAFGSYAEIFVLSLLLSSGSVWFVLLRLYFAMDQNGSIDGAYYGLSRSSRFDLNSVDDYGIVRNAMGYSAVAFDKGMVSPSLWYLIGGLPFVFIYCVLSFFSWRFGRCGHGSGFSDVPSALERLMGYVPSIFAGGLLCLASAVTPTAKMLDALKIWWAKRGVVVYEQGGFAMSAMAWSLRINLGGPVRDLGGVLMKNDWVGEEGGSARVERHHLKRAIFMNVIGLLLFILSLLSAYVYSVKLGW